MEEAGAVEEEAGRWAKEATEESQVSAERSGEGGGERGGERPN